MGFSLACRVNEWASQAFEKIINPGLGSKLIMLLATVA
jgi:hypothetical protein